MAYVWKLKNNKKLYAQDGDFVSYTSVSANKRHIDNIKFSSTNFFDIFDKMEVGGKCVFENNYYMKILEVGTGRTGSPLRDYKQYKIAIFDNNNNLTHSGNNLTFVAYDEWQDKYSGLCIVNTTIGSETGLAYRMGYMNRNWYISNLNEDVLITDYDNNGTPVQLTGFIPKKLNDNIAYRSFYDVLFLLIPNEKSYGGKDTGDPSTTGGQNGDYDDKSDIIPVPSIPDISLVSCGMVSCYKMTNSGLSALSEQLWSSNTELLENLKKMFTDDPMSAIMSLSLIPLNLSGNSTNIKLGNYTTDISGEKLTSQYYQLDCGSLKINEYWGNFLDYSPYTKAELYLPMCGTHSISIDDIMGKSVNIKYIIDIISGSCNAFVLVDNSIMYNFSGNCILQLPLNGRNAIDLYTSMIRSAVGVATLGTTSATGSAVSGELIAQNIVSSGMNILGNKGTIQHGGSMTGGNGVLGVKYPVLTFTRANQSLPTDFYKFKGYTSNIMSKISELHGYTEVQYIHYTEIEGITKNELDELDRILKSGFIV